MGEMGELGEKYHVKDAVVRYSRCMRTTKRDQAVAELVGQAPSTVARHRIEGLWPDDGTADLVRHYEVMESLGLGPGRDRWIVVLQAAAYHKWVTVQLRNDLARPWPDLRGMKLDPDQAIEANPVWGLVSTLLRTTALASDEVQDMTGRRSLGWGTPEQVAEGIATESIGAVHQQITGQPTSPDDYGAMSVLVDTAVDGIAADTVEEPTPSSDRPLSVDVQREVQAFAGNLAGSSEWARTASRDDLVWTVKFSDDTVRQLETAANKVLTETEHWSLVRMLASVFGPQKSAIEPVADGLLAYLEAIQRPPTEPAIEG